MGKFHCAFFGLVVLVTFSCSSDQSNYTVTEGAFGQHTFCFTGPLLNEQSATNPFLDVRLLLALDGPEGERLIPGFYAADGNAAETSAQSGDQWCVHARGFAAGTYSGEVFFEKGEELALRQINTRGDALPGNGEKVTFDVASSTTIDGWLSLIHI